jgi:glycosyltransferase involved in cell wall biosynthesis
MEDLKIKFSKIPFFVRIFEYNNKIVLWNDHKIKMELDKNSELLEKSDLVNTVKKIFSEKIEKKYNEMKNRRVSVIIPNYNNEKFIKKTIDSILNNTYPFIEIIFVDDCSTDKSVEIVRENYGNNRRVKIFENKENRGAYYCRNKGILLSNGYYITIVDGDDYIEKDKLEYEVNKLNELGDEYWGYGTRFQRIYFNDDIENITHINRSNSFVFLFRRKLFNYLGFFQDNRFGADSEFYKRSKIFNYELFCDKEKVFYNAYTVSGKNLTQIHRAEERREYMDKCIGKIKRREYIEMALLDDKEDFKEIIGMNN